MAQMQGMERRAKGVERHRIIQRQNGPGPSCEWSGCPHLSRLPESFSRAQKMRRGISPSVGVVGRLSPDCRNDTVIVPESFRGWLLRRRHDRKGIDLGSPVSPLLTSGRLHAAGPGKPRSDKRGAFVTAGNRWESSAIPVPWPLHPDTISPVPAPRAGVSTIPVGDFPASTRRPARSTGACARSTGVRSRISTASTR